MPAHLRLLAHLAALAAALAGAPSLAHACTQVGPLKLDGYPRDGAEDVPVDVVPVYQLTLGEFPSGIMRAQDIIIPSDGGVVQLTLPDGGTQTLLFPQGELPEAMLSHAGGSAPVSVRWAQRPHFEIVATSALLPGTDYTLEVRWKERANPNTLGDLALIDKSSAVHFRTGGAAYAGDTSAPPVFATQLLGRASSCDPPPRTVCFSLPDEEALYVAQFEHDPQVRLERGSFFNNRPYTDPEDELDCMTIRRRAPNGTLGEPARSCRAERTVVDIDQLRERERGIAGLGCKSDGLYLVDRPVAELFEEQERERAREEAAASAEDESSEPVAPEAPRARKDTSCSLAPASDTDRALAMPLVALAASLILRRRRRERR